MSGIVQEVLKRRYRDLGMRAWDAFLLKTGTRRRQFQSTELAFQDLPDAAQDLNPLNLFAIQGEPQSLPNRYCQKVQEYAAGNYRVFGSKVSIAAEALDWHAAIQFPGHWPQCHWTEIPYRELAHLGDIKFPWELARQQFLVPMAMVARQTADPQLVEQIEATILSFANANRHECGIHFISNMEIGLRCITWLWVTSLLNDQLSISLRQTLLVQLFQSAEHLFRRIGFTVATGPNNHLIGDASCLLLLAKVFQQYAKAQKWASRAERLLRQSIRRQITSDGMHFEMSFGYHRFVMEFLWNLVLGRCGSDTLQKEVRNTLVEMSDCLSWARLPDGTLPSLNDNDDGTALPLTITHTDQTGLLLQLAIDRLDMPLSLSGDGETVKFLAKCLRETHSQEHSANSVSAPSNTTHHAHGSSRKKTKDLRSGVLIKRSGSGDILLFDHHQDPFPDSGHNHASLAHMMLWIDESPLLVDSGTFGYNGVSRQRNYLRSTMAHNCVCIGEKGQATPHRNFGWISKAIPGSIQVNDDGQLICVLASHGCYTEGTYSRCVLWDMENRVVLVRDHLDRDTVSSNSPIQLEQYWHLHSDWQITQQPSAVRLRQNSLVDWHVVMPSPDIQTTSSKHHFELISSDQDIRTLWSPAYGIAQCKPTIYRTFLNTGNQPLWTIISPNNEVTWRREGASEFIKVGTWQYLFRNDSTNLAFVRSESRSVKRNPREINMTQSLTD